MILFASSRYGLRYIGFRLEAQPSLPEIWNFRYWNSRVPTATARQHSRISDRRTLPGGEITQLFCTTIVTIYNNVLPSVVCA